MTRMKREDRAAKMRNDRRENILDAAIVEAEKVGYKNIGRNAVAARAGVANGSVNHAFATLSSLKYAVMVEAVARGNTAIVAQGLADNHPIARQASPELKQAAISALA